MLVKDRKRKNEERSNESLKENTIRLKKSKIRIIDDRSNKSFEKNKIRLNKDKKRKGKVIMYKDLTDETKRKRKRKKKQ